MFRLFLFLSLGLYGWSLFLPVYSDKPDLLGLYALLAGWMVGLNDIPTAVSWLANIFYFMALFSILKRKKPRAGAALVYSILAIAIGAAILGAGKAITGVSETVAKLSLGMAFYAWIASFVLMAVAAWFKRKQPVTATATDDQLIDEINKS